MSSPVSLPYPRALTHVGLTVTDLDGAVRWYQEVLGFRVVFGPVDLVSDETHFGRICQDLFGSAFGKGRLVHMTGANGVVIEVFEFERPKSIAPDDNFQYWKNGVFHLCFVEPEIETMAKRIADSGGKQRSRVWPLFADKPYKIVYCEDPFGNIIELNSHSTEQVWSNG
jgi:catechol 2,3-dioxygenase-like lactoylglutathione lyase family enzyme